MISRNISSKNYHHSFSTGWFHWLPKGPWKWQWTSRASKTSQ